MSNVTVRRPQFLKPVDQQSEQRTGRLVLEERLNDVAIDPESSGSNVYNNPYASLSIQQQRTRLPIFKNRNHIIYLLERYQTLVIVGETGCGKSTQVPQYLLEAGWASDERLIAITEPRRVAAVTLASRVAEERMCILGQDVGYVVRFDDMTDFKTKIKYMTDGILIREMMQDPLLTKYSVIMVDEAHERSINTDLMIGLLRKIITKRTDLRVIISSATLDAELFRNFFELNDSDDRSKDTSSIISVEGRMHPVRIYFAKSPVPNYAKAAVETTMTIHCNEPTGDVLIFLTGQEEVEMACEMLREKSKALKNVDRLWIVPMYGTLPAREQLKAFDSAPHGTRKVVISTNIAEASITIPGIAYVIDCGFVKLRALNPKNGIESLMILPISQASAEQRAGRAGRIRPGKCYRLYPESEYDKLLTGTIPEMQRTHLAPVILQLKALGVDNVLRFNYIARPPAYAMIQGLELLYALGGIDHRGHLTNPLGMNMCEFPLAPMHAKTLLTSAEFGCSEEIATIIAMLQIQDVFIVPTGQRHKAELMKRKFSVEEGDHLTMLNVFSNFQQNGATSKWCSDHYVNYRGLCRAADVRNQMIRLLKKYNIPLVSCRGLIGETAKVRRCLVNGFFSNAAKYHYTGAYHTVKEDYPLKIYKGSTIMYRKTYPEWVIFTEVLQDSMRDISVIEPEWLYELAPHYYEYGTDSEIATKRSRVDNSNMEAANKANFN